MPVTLPFVAIERNQYEKRILRVLQYIYENPNGDLSLDKLADVAAMSRFHWHRIFLGLTGETCAQAVRRIRLHRAAYMLVTDRKSVSIIANEIGYPSSQSFIRAFSERYSISPGVFRKEGQFSPFSNTIKKGNPDMFKVDITDVPQRRLAAIFNQGAYINIAQHFENLATIVSSRNLWPKVKGVLGVYYDDPSSVAEADLRSYAAIEIDDKFEIFDSTRELILEGGAYAVLHYKGPYTSMQPAYNFLYGEWLVNSGRELRDEPCYELYLNSPSDTAPENLLTDIYMPLK